MKEFSDLASMNGWRKILSNFYVEPFDLDGQKWNSVEHFYHAQKFKKGNPEFYLKFSLDSNSEIKNYQIGHYVFQSILAKYYDKLH